MDYYPPYKPLTKSQDDPAPSAQTLFYYWDAPPELAGQQTYPSLHGGLGIGKTLSGAAKNIRNGIAYPCDYAVVAPDFTMMHTATLPMYVRLLAAGDEWVHPKTRRRAKGLCYLQENGVYHHTLGKIETVFDTDFWFRSAHEPEKLYGTNLGGFHI